jgi:hypothetical protein
MEITISLNTDGMQVPAGANEILNNVAITNKV